MTIRERWQTGGVQVEGLLYRATADNLFTEELTSHLLGWSVSWNSDRGAGDKLSLQLELDRRELVAVQRDWVAPVLRLTWGDGLVEEQQFGLFVLDYPGETIYAAHAVAVYDGFDPTWRLQNSVVRDTYNIAGGTNRSTALADVITPVWPRVVLPAIASTLPADRSWFPYTARYEIAADQADGMGWYQPFPDLTGQIESRPYVDLAAASPVMTVEEADFEGTLKVVPTTTQLANIVVVSKPGLADDAPLQSIRENSNAADPTSTANREPLVRRIPNNDIQTQDEADALAEEYLRSGKTIYQVVSGELPPGVWMRPYQTIQLIAEHPVWGNLSGRYGLRTWTVGSSPSDNVKVELNRFVEAS